MSVLTPAKVLVQAESVQTGRPVAQSLFSTIGQATNYSITNVSQIGDIVTSILNEAAFTTLRDASWVLCDGRSIAGSELQTLTGLANAPDLRGRYQRMKDNGAGVDPAGDLALGSTYADEIATHAHDAQIGLPRRITPFGGGPDFGLLTGNGTGSVSIQTYTNRVVPPGGAETRVKSLIVNYFIKINTSP